MILLLIFTGGISQGKQGARPSHANVSYGLHPHQLLDIYLPQIGKTPFPVMLWHGDNWKAEKYPVKVDLFHAKWIALIVVVVRTASCGLTKTESH